MHNIRFDYIENIGEEYCKRMEELRAMYIELDLAIQEMEDDENCDQECGAQRTISITRTKLEESLHYAIKSLCLIGENTH